MRIAIAQIPMHWEMRDNVAAMADALRVARDDGAAICAFAELAVTGFHRRIVDWARPGRSGPAVAELCAAAARLGVATVFGAPTYRADGSRLNSHLFVDATGAHVGTVSKNGLTAPEATFFAPGVDRPTVTLAGLRCTAVICREFEDAESILPGLLDARPDVVFWPGQMRPDPAKPVQDPPEHVVAMQELARRASVHVVQTNWPNALNRPEEGAQAGRSACIGPDGTLLFRLPLQGFGVGVFDLGSSDVDWYPCDA